MAIYNYQDEKSAPINNSGIIAWVKEKLFSTYFDAILTIFSLYFLYMIIPPLLDWLVFDATWSGSKDNITKDGARWIFIFEKFHQFMYGFYPQEYYWRPNLAYFLAFIFAISFVQIKNSYIRLVLLLVYPIIGFILIYGGFGLEIVPTNKWGGLLATLVIASVGIVCSFPIGVLFALGRESNMPVIRTLSIVYIEFIRGVPLITILFVASVILPLFFPTEISFDKLLRALIGITLFQSAYIAEIIRGGLLGVDKGQYEAGDSLGLTYWKSMRLIILPQAIKISIPNLVGASISLLKDTTLVLIIGIFDILSMVGLTNSDNKWLGFEIEGYVFVAMVYWIFCFSMSKYASLLEKKMEYKG